MLTFALGFLTFPALAWAFFKLASRPVEETEFNYVEQPLEDQTDRFGEAAAGGHGAASNVREAHDHA